jgi:hypothetical protein
MSGDEGTHEMNTEPREIINLDDWRLRIRIGKKHL